jgi:hypothetical protein
MSYEQTKAAVTLSELSKEAVVHLAHFLHHRRDRILFHH